MDNKGITWVGTIYQKFEDMCLEVEEIMYEDTVKYVENQVQTVGDSMKKFYSDVIQDLLPPPSMDNVKQTVSGARGELDTNVGVYVKPKVGFKEKHGKVDETDKLTEDKKMLTDSNLDRSHEVFHLDNLLPPASRHCNKRNLFKKSNLDTIKSSGIRDPSPKETFDNSSAGLISCSEKPREDDIGQLPEYPNISTDNDSGQSPTSAGVCCADYLLPLCLEDSSTVAPRRSDKVCKKSNLDGNKNYRREKQYPNEPSGVLASVEHLNRLASRCEIIEPSCEQKAGTSTSESVQAAMHNTSEENLNEIGDDNLPNILTNQPPCDMITFAESGWSNGMDMRLPSCGSSLEESNDDCMNNGLVSPLESVSNGSIRSNKFTDEEYLVSNLDNHSMDVDEDDIAIERGIELMQQVEDIAIERGIELMQQVDDIAIDRGIELMQQVDDIAIDRGIELKQQVDDIAIERGIELMQQVERPRLDETCVMVNGDEFQFIPPNEGKSKACKRNIRDVFSRKRSMRKQEYKQLAVWGHGGAEVDQAVDVKSSMTALTGKGSSEDLCESEWELL